MKRGPRAGVPRVRAVDIDADRICTKCGVRKPKDREHFAASGKAGLTGQCRECIHARIAAWKRARPRLVTARKPRNNKGFKNSRWKGGRMVGSNGYVLIKVEPGHHLADARGYAYEHRLVAEQKIGRCLQPGEIVHHKDENKQNNAPENLEVLPTRAHHKVEHRRVGLDRQLPGESNPLIACACGCGANFTKFDEGGRPRRFVSGHHRGNLGKRWSTRDTRLSGEPNPEIACACGCGTAFPKYDSGGRPRRFIRGHQGRAAAR